MTSTFRIKKAYRRKALELHPDRNYGNVENATKQFAEIQSAYEILSDPQERAWYDSHRDAILRNDETHQDYFESNIRVTTSSDIITLIGRFTKSVPFTDAPNGFYGSLRSTFFTLAKEEETTCECEGLEAIPYPDFGTANDSYEEVVRPFYAVWMAFTTKKTFSWMDTYKYADAPDRRIRRLMEKENKRLRDEAIKEFNDVVRSLVAFVRKRDPRYIPNTQSEAERQRLLRDAAAAQAARSRAANQAKLNESVLPDWIINKEVEEEIFTESELSEEERHECVICSKSFKSEKQYETHEKSKKHIKAVQQIRRQMYKENKALELDSSAVTDDDDNDAILRTRIGGSRLNIQSKNSVQSSEKSSWEHTSDADAASPHMSARNPKQLKKTIRGLAQGVSHGNIREDGAEDVSYDDDYDDLAAEYGPSREVEGRISKLMVMDAPPWTSDILETLVSPESGNSESNKGSVASNNGNGEATRRIGKARAKRAKKAARQESASLSESVPIVGLKPAVTAGVTLTTTARSNVTPVISLSAQRRSYLVISRN